MVWSHVGVKGFCPSGRAGHSADLVGEYMYLFGGMQAGTRVNTTVALNVEDRTWSRVNTSGAPPSARSEHASWVHNDVLYIQGGESSTPMDEDAESEAGGGLGSASLGKSSSKASISFGGATHKRLCLDDLHALDTTTFKWTQIHTRLAPLPRKAHTATVLDAVTGSTGSTAVLFGGIASGLGEPLDDLVMLDLSMLGSWKAMWVKPEIEGTAPSARFGHSATAITDHSIVIFGGATSTTTFVNDMHMLDLKKMQWHRVSSRGLPPRARQGHTVVKIPARVPRRPPMLVVFGGVSVVHDEQHFPKDMYTFDLVNRQWAEVRTGYNFPAPRYGHTLLVVPPRDDDGEDALMTFGGPTVVGSAGAPAMKRNSIISASAPQLAVPNGHRWPKQTPIDAARRDSRGGGGPLTPIPARSRGSTVVGGSPGAGGGGDDDGHLGSASQADGGAPEVDDDAGLVRPRVPDCYMLLFGGLNHKYCTSEVWKLRVRRRSSWLYKGADRSRADDSGPSSGSDSDHPADGTDIRAFGSLIEEFDKPEDEAASASGAGGGADGDAGSSSGTRAALEVAIMVAKKDRLRMETRLQKEIAARVGAEKSRDELNALLKAATAQLATQKTQHEKALAASKLEYERRIEEAEARARQSRADLQRVTHLLCLHDLAANLRLEVVKRRSERGARPTSAVSTSLHPVHSVGSDEAEGSGTGSGDSPRGVPLHRPMSAGTYETGSDVFVDDDDLSVHEGQL